MRWMTTSLITFSFFFYFSGLLISQVTCTGNGLTGTVTLSGSGTYTDLQLLDCMGCTVDFGNETADCSGGAILTTIIIEGNIELDGSWDLRPAGDVTLIIAKLTAPDVDCDPFGSSGSLSFSGNSMGSGSSNPIEELRLTASSILVIENTCLEAGALVATESAGADRIFFGDNPTMDEVFKGNEFDDLILGGGFNLNLLPISLLSFQATARQDGVHLSWATATETGNDYFDVEHSRTGSDFVRIGGRRGAGASLELRRYSLQHADPAPGINYYRLKQVDFDGAYSYSPVVAVRVDGGGDLTVAPNPAQRRLNIYAPDTGADALIEVYNLLGQSIRPLIQRNGEVYEVDLPADLVAGQYLVRVTQGGMRYVEMVMVK